MARFVIAPRARADLTAIAEYISRDNPEAASQLIAAFASKFRQLAERPLMGRPRWTLRADLRSVPLGRYVIYYWPVEDGIEVVRVLHSALDIPKAFRE